MSFLVLSTMAKSSACSVSGTPNLSSVCLKSSRNACHSCSVILQVGMRIVHGPAGVTLTPARGFAHLLAHQVLEPGSCNLVVGFVHLGVGVQPCVVHEPVDEIIHHSRDGIDPAEAFVEGHWLLSFSNGGPRPDSV